MSPAVAETTSPSSLDLTAATLFLFPGQGSQVKRMREAVAERLPDLLELAIELLGQDPFERSETSTHVLQPAIYLASLAGWLHALERNGGEDPAAMVGHSLGEITALVVAGALSFEGGLRIVVLRGSLMESAAAESARAGAEGGMMAVFGSELGRVARMAAHAGLTIAGDNAPGQVVLTGDVAALDRAAKSAPDIGAKTMRLPIPGAFHSPALRGIRGPFEDAIRALDLRPLRVPVYSSLTSEPFDDIARRLADSLTLPVRWRPTLLALRDAGARRFVEVGPGKVLSALVWRTLPDAEAFPVEDWNGTWLIETETA